MPSRPSSWTWCRHLLALVNDVLDISKIEAGQLEVAREPFDLETSLRKALTLVEPMAKGKGLELAVAITPGLGTAEGDARRFQQVLINLLNNAVKFTEKGRVFLYAERQAGAVRVRVEDTGMGIKPENLQDLFRPFKQLDTGLSRQHEGTGLGLAICRRLVGLMGGTIEAASEWGKGSVFTVTLPLKGGGPCP
jgi:signal transduction histidine kinase